MAVARWVIGVILSLVGCTLSNTGVNFQKLCHTKLAADAAAGKPVKPFYLQPLWVGGLASIVVGSIMDLVSFAFASLSLLAPLGAMVRVGPPTVRHKPLWTTMTHAVTILTLQQKFRAFPCIPLRLLWCMLAAPLPIFVFRCVTATNPCTHARIPRRRLL